MIQVCSRCRTRWNVREKRRDWCPRCNGALWPPLPPEQEAALQRPQTPVGGPQAPAAPRPAPAYRWIAVRPGPPPPPRRRRRPLGPTPRYQVIPRWTLMQWPQPVPPGAGAAPAAPGGAAGPAPATVARWLSGTVAALGIAAGVYVLVYLLMLLNRTRLLYPLVAEGMLWLSRVASVTALGAVIGCAAVLTQWLVAARAATFARAGRPDPRRPRVLWLGCLTPVVNLFWAPVWVIELARLDNRLSRLRLPIIRWWAWWAAATGMSIWALATSGAQTAQAIANNTVAMIVAYLVGLAAVLAAARVVDGFGRDAAARPAHHWVVVADGPAPAPAPAAAPAPVPAEEPAADEPADEPAGRESAA